ncbi:MAG: (deoxy)nucleoside triphosphate pyrophosphohydrolase [Pirellulales bacterium]|nr:(deoxy)nucleoside triphosphate pyrophosphohydrolase [Pirellulales bacterium]
MPEPAPIAIAVVEHEGQVLIGQRPAGVALAGYWEFPGGKIATGETPEAAAARECREETGLEVRILRPLATLDHQYEHGTVRLHFLAAEPVADAAIPAPPFRWIPRSELGDYRFPPANAGILKRLTSG